MKLDKSYQPSAFEADIYALWEKNQAFIPSGKGSPFSMVVPPPNANGNLHMGHALAFALQDIAARYHRSKGDSVLFVPGADHAGFETQVVFEHELEKQGKSRFDFTRDELYGQIYDFVAANRHNLESQIRKLGASVDWSRYCFSLDKKIVSRAYATFKSMWDDGLIYRSERLVNFCSFHGTGFADIEVDHKEEKGTLWEIAYPLSDGSGSVTVATTRPETMFGDTAVAINPSDDSYRGLAGKTLLLPLTKREIPIIEDEAVKTDFGSGAVKVTPAHDPTDYDIGQRHDLPLITVIGFDGKLNHNVPEPFRGLSVKEGRDATVKALKQLGLLSSETPLIHSVGHCYKCGTVIEPLLMEQWFVDTKPLAQKALKLLEEGKIRFYPQVKLNQLRHYLEGIRDWNISRQNAWGIPIPAFQNESDPGDWIFDERADQEYLTVNKKIYRRDPDVFDTWFSSSSWPYATLDYPGGDAKEYYPLSLMETGYDLLLPWVSRMIMLGLYVTDEAPFGTVYMHGMVTDNNGLKMSKSRGNVTDPILVVNEYGSDALRIGIVSGQAAGSNQMYSPDRVIGGRNFCNKLWNIARYVSSQSVREGESSGVELRDDADHWISLRLIQTIQVVDKLMTDYRISESWEQIYHFIWDDFADWYLEASKAAPNSPLLKTLMEAIMVLVHPFAPFISESLWQNLEINPGSLLSGREMPKLPVRPGEVEAKRFQALCDLVSVVRSNIKAVGAKTARLYYQDEPLIDAHGELLKRLTGLASVEKGDSSLGIALTGTTLNAWLQIDREVVDEYLRKLDSSITNTQGVIKKLKTRLSSREYVAKAPKALVDDTKAQLAEADQLLNGYLEERLRYR